MNHAIQTITVLVLGIASARAAMAESPNDRDFHDVKATIERSD